MSEAWPTEESPFVFEGPVPADQVVGRTREIASLCASAEGGRSICLMAPRRYGKTSLLFRVADELRARSDMVAIIVDLYGTHSLADLTVRLERAYSRQLRGPIRAFVDRLFAASELGLALSAGGIGMELQRRPRADPLPALHTLLDLPVRVAERTGRSWIVFDEFQALLHVADAEGILRSHIQHHREVASYVFAGSEPGMLERLFGDRSRPFYAQAELRRLERLPNDALAEAIESAFLATERSPGEQLSPLLATAAGHPQRAMLLAHHLWLATPPGQVATEDGWLAAFERVRERTAIEASTWYRGLSTNQQRVLRALAVWGSPYGRDAHALVGLSEGNVGAVVRQLLASGDLEREPAGGYRFVDPLFERWVRDTFALDVS